MMSKFNQLPVMQQSIPSVHEFTQRDLRNVHADQNNSKNSEPVKMLKTSEKIYYNPKFLLNHVKTEAQVYNQQLYPDKTLDSRIHINRRYLASLNGVNNGTENPSSSMTKLIFGGIHVNPKFIQKHQTNETVNVINSGSSVVNQPLFDSSATNDLSYAGYENCDNKHSISKYKFIKTTISPPKCSNSSTKSVCIKTKYSLKRVGSNRNTSNEIIAKCNPSKNQLTGRLSWSEFKKVSRTKLVRKSVLHSLILARRRSSNILLKRTALSPVKRSPNKKRTLNVSQYKLVQRNSTLREKYSKINGTAANSSFKKLGKMKIIRKSLLKTQIEARNQVKKQALLDYRNWNSYTLTNFSPKFVNKQSASLKWKTKKQTSDPVLNKCKRSNVQTLKYLRKNNQPCPFYNRFGRCKGKDRGTCTKLHDPLYISICRKLLQGECDSKDCLLSHKVIPGKMPTCHHYLAGLCTRANCPFLHIKVNPKAPICIAFLQGYCPDVFNCMKRHEFICPIYAEKGVCPRGKSCTYPHRSPVMVLTKLLKDDQKPLMVHPKEMTAIDSSNSCYSGVKKTNKDNDDDDEVSEPNESRLFHIDGIGGHHQQRSSSPDHRKPKKNYVKEVFTRYFAVTDSSDGCKEVLSESNETTGSDEGALEIR